ncbi:hypothetical protein JQ554_30480 [Bradyrhizobium diazoefficiens]|nr:hypothetical protein [Bradyrhizobium diazoefficiens]MBR0968500.1 hypothetical protein [Bradyrhizobium diazoefficiens]MBR0981824.1 hypothetical protein [Bradyrhizobium diazoefficiens]MBR1011275.1 hypothetical protein [Bradyrhizobium diazoefficiens]MBR1015742.1 hypothetical protein [Bradyrhizobium diazoefficiens]MBR1055115.1 hypothetical protein [Bradyrhizobium diazoefficiens]
MSISEAAWFVMRSTALPLSSIPLFFLLYVNFPALRGSLVAVSLSIPGFLYPVCFILAFGFSASMLLILFPGMLIIPLIAVASIRTVSLIADGRREDLAFLSTRTLITSGAVILMYASIWYEFHIFDQVE